MIPDFQTIMLPLLKFFSDGKEHAKREVVDYISDEFSLTDEERFETYPISGVKKIYSRTDFAERYLKGALILESIRRGYCKITDRGLSVLKNNPEKIDIKFLSQFPEFVEFRNRRRQEDEDQTINKEETEQTPLEQLEKGYAKIKADLARELLLQVKQCSPEFFEKLVVELLLKMGYGGSREDAGEALGRAHDGGIDGIIKEDRLGLDAIYIQAKRWNGSIGAPLIREFIGALARRNANKGVFITTSTFTDAAQDAIQGPFRVILIDGELLTRLMIDYNIGVATKVAYEVKEIDTDYFIDE